jgi:hypothetical protein
MNFAESIVFYLVIGLAVGIAALAVSTGGVWRRFVGAAAAVVFWPLFLPLLLTAGREGAAQPTERNCQARDPLAAHISQVNRELCAALASLDGWAEVALAHERLRITELKRTWDMQAERIREMETLLSQADWKSPSTSALSADGDALSRSEQARREHFGRLQAMCSDARRDLLSTLAWVRELAAMIHLAKFSGAPASRAEELVSQIAAAVEGLSEVSRANL